jgi:predicted dehydrogenase
MTRCTWDRRNVNRHNVDRRTFLRWTTAGGILAGYHVNSTSPSVLAEVSPNERLNLAAVGASGRAAANIQACASQNIIAIADVDSQMLEKGAQPYPHARKYRDFREMLEKDEDKIDAVLIGTPDHTHAVAAAMALRMKKHVYCEKPLTHTVQEARTLTRLARENQLVTQMGNQIHAGDNYRRVVEQIQAGTIGSVKEVHVWVNVEYAGGKFTTGSAPPAHLDWDLWQGPAAERPYSEGIHPFHWRRFWDYGNGGLGDFGCHYMDLAHWALDLKHPVRVSARGPAVDPVSPPPWLTCQYDYPAREDLPPVKLTWYDGRNSAQRVEPLGKLRGPDGQPLQWRSGQLFVGEQGMLISDYSRHLLLPVEKFQDHEPPEPTIPSSIGHHAEWLQAIRDQGETTCNFDYAGALTEAVLLGIAAYRSGETIEWDAERLRATEGAKVDQFLHREYRDGWVL